ncbi:phosphoribosyltransferase [Candidatus Cerribacteria bacterium 'Amazon FNV 2010 28 9']|uniref:Phosphoribosyltransferase n=1 Tax=Candidatus Cerribacteria bacterium 'Amazon FNV 2010 28 9' TaxID=2081795 RepID=A0A317JMG4_9BACT|nr:MAG: phosphoribosyltransferase [Candidatus Cerribacteria bacterium 'Amazon FNV 2010 28 9']
MTPITIHDQTFEVYSWEKFGKHVFELSKKIVESGESFDRIVALAQGGTVIARAVSDHIGVKNVSSIQISFYTGIESKTKTPVITQSLPVTIKGERVLIIDDIADSGETLLMASEYMRWHGAEESKTATLVVKPWTKKTPDFWYHKTQAWIVYPWETRETIQLLTQIWKDKGDSGDSIVSHLQSLGYSLEEIELFGQK